MVDTSAKLKAITTDYIDKGRYFVINRGRQFGKTTTLSLLTQALDDTCLMLNVSFEGSEALFESFVSFAEGLRGIIYKELKTKRSRFAGIFSKCPFAPLSFMDLEDRIQKLCQKSKKPVVLLIDEVDKASNYEVFSSFLGKLRDMYLKRDEQATFKSVILAGVHDIKNLKKKIRPESEHTTNSPWNIATDFTLDMSFHPDEIKTMLAQYEEDHHTGMDMDAVSERIYFWTFGYPFLVSDICKIIEETPLAWDSNGVDEAAKYLLAKPNLLFDDMVKNLDMFPELNSMTRSIVLEGASVPESNTDQIINIGKMYGIYRADENRKIIIANRIFQNTLLDYYSTKEEIKGIISRYLCEESQFIQNGILDMETVLKKFSIFMKSEYRDQDSGFIEREGRLLFLSFLRPIINGKGNYAVESETRGSKRMDIIVFYGGKEYLVELKIWRGESYEASGMQQLADYVKGRSGDKAYLLSYANLQKSPRQGGWQTIDGINIYEEIVAYKDKML
jgi:hypothetical protein